MEETEEDRQTYDTDSRHKKDRTRRGCRLPERLGRDRILFLGNEPQALVTTAGWELVGRAGGEVSIFLFLWAGACLLG